jgi:hypothetical protein
MLQLHAFGPGFLLALVTMAGLVAAPIGGPEPETDEGARGLGAIPSNQVSVSTSVVSTSSTLFVNLGAPVTIDNGTSTRNVVITYSAEVRVSDVGDVFVLGTRVDSGPCSALGSGAFARSTLTEIRTAVFVRSIGAGTHTIQPCFRVSPDGDGAQVIQSFVRTLIVEGRTK